MTPEPRPGRLRILLLLAALLLAAFFLVAFLSWTDPDAPRYLALKTQPSGPFGTVHYDWGGAAPFVNGKVWLFTIGGRTNGHEYLFDMEQRKVLGELFNAEAIFCNGDETKLLCEGRASLQTSLKSKIGALLLRASFGRIRFATDRVEAYWLLDLRNNSAHRVGDLSQIPGTGSHWKPSPGFRFGLNVPNNSEEDLSFFVCDLDRETFRKIPFKGNVRGWWDDHHILIKLPAGDLVLFDVLAETTSTLVDRETLAKRLREFELDETPENLTTYSYWTGTNYDFSLVSRQGQAWYTNGAFMLKLERPRPSLALRSRDFKFKWQGSFNEAGTYYVFDGEKGVPGQGGNGGVYLLDLAADKTNTLVPPDYKGQYAIARFYRDNIVYFRTRELCIIKIDGSGNSRLFSPPDK